MIIKRPFGLGSTLYTIDNGKGISADITDYGAAIVALRVPSKQGTVDAVLGFESAEGYRDDSGDYIGATIARYANRIGGAQFTLDGVTYHVKANQWGNCLHGGGDNHLRLWQAEVRGDALVFTLDSPDGEYGFPGAMKAQVTYWLDDHFGLHMDYLATSDRPTLCNMTNHAYFNFTEDREDVLKHELFINADTYTVVDDKLLPTGDAPVAGTPFDFRTPRPIKETFYDNSFNLRGGEGPQATVYEKNSGVLLEVFTDLPALQIFSSGTLQERNGKHGAHHGLGGGIVLETQLPPDAPNRPECAGLRDRFTVTPERPWKSTTIYRFSIR